MKFVPTLSSLTGRNSHVRSVDDCFGTGAVVPSHTHRLPIHFPTDYRGNYDSYVKTRDEKIKNDMRVYHAYQDKRAHMMEFIEKFRANAKRATMVQSRIKAVEVSCRHEVIPLQPRLDSHFVGIFVFTAENGCRSSRACRD